jgi:hypothetical protein
LCLSIRKMQRTGAQNVNIDSYTSQEKLSVVLELEQPTKVIKNGRGKFVTVLQIAPAIT